MLTYKNIHFIGIYGSGMSAIAQYVVNLGVTVTGSDRYHNSLSTKKLKHHLQVAGCLLFAQDGSGITDETEVVVVSTAIEDTVADVVAARQRNIPIIHRSDLLAQIVKSKKTIAIAGTSGKSTVTAMVFEFLTACGKFPSLISGAPLKSLEQQGFYGNAYNGASDLLIIEADESDGSLVKYEPYGTVILNLSKDHKPVDEVKMLFDQLLSQSEWTVLNADDPHFMTTPSSTTFGFNIAAHFFGMRRNTDRPVNIVNVNGDDFEIPLPGIHNAANLLAALCVCYHFGCYIPALQQATAHFKGVHRRFNVTKTAADVTVIDDFAHNPEKIRAAVTAARSLYEQLTIIYQPHGFGPTRFLKDDYIATFKEIVRPNDSLILLPIFYSGGTAVKDISSEHIIDGLGEVDFPAYALAEREDVFAFVKKHTKPGSAILLMGARDPNLPILGQQLINLYNK